MTPSIGRIVHYKLTDNDSQQINRRRTSGNSIAERIRDREWPVGAQAHIGNNVAPGDEYPVIVTHVWSPGMFNGQVFLDGNDTLWVTSVHEGTENGTWHWPERVD